MKIYNTKSRKVEDFLPLSGKDVKMYSCGPTVYDTAHIGNLRTFIMNDLLRRSLEWNGYTVNHVMNITDVDDKTINRSRAEKLSLNDITKKYEELFFIDLEALNILKPNKVMRATENVLEMISFIEKLIKKGVAYPSKDGIYLSIGMIPNYGELAQIKLDAHTESRTANDEYEKENPRDFALWKFAVPEDGEAVWEAPFGNGRPGWHIECSAMAIKALGPTIDIHTGGSDLIFPHHVNEIAQSESLTGQQFVKYWVHGGFINVDDTKMSKSKSNFIKLENLKEKGISPLSFRYWLLTSHYRSQVNFTFEAVEASQQALLRLARHIVDWSENTKGKVADPNDTKVKEIVKEFKEKISNDLDIPGSLALLWTIIKDTKISDEVKLAVAFEIDKIFGLGLYLLSQIEAPKIDIPVEITALAEAREEARRGKEWDKADALRKEIEERGYKVVDKGNTFEIKEG